MFSSIVLKYFCNLVSSCHLKRTLTPQGKNFRVGPKMNTVRCGQRSYSNVAAVEWNSLPQELRNTSTLVLWSQTQDLLFPIFLRLLIFS